MLTPVKTFAPDSVKRMDATILNKLATQQTDLVKSDDEVVIIIEKYGNKQA